MIMVSVAVRVRVEAMVRAWFVDGVLRHVDLPGDVVHS